jgi:hypothetical protein
MGYQVEKIINLNKNIGNPVNIIPPVEPDNMPSEYKNIDGWFILPPGIMGQSVGQWQ